MEYIDKIRPLIATKTNYAFCFCSDFREFWAIHIQYYNTLFLCALTSARESVPLVTVPTLAAETARRVFTRGVQMAREILIAVAAAFVHVRTLEPIVQTLVSGVALAWIRTGCVYADRRVQVAVVTVWTSDARTFVHICLAHQSPSLRHAFI